MDRREFHPTKGQAVERVKLTRSRELRREMTEAERVLWDHLRGGRVGGVRFRRQQVIDGFIVDFYCHAARLVIEVDGAAHTDQAEYDHARDSALSARGLNVMRVTNDEVLGNLAGVLERIRRDLTP